MRLVRNRRTGPVQGEAAAVAPTKHRGDSLFVQVSVERHVGQAAPAQLSLDAGKVRVTQAWSLVEDRLSLSPGEKTPSVTR